MDRDVAVAFGEAPDSFDRRTWLYERSTMANWLAAMKTGTLSQDPVRKCWDLDVACPAYLGNKKRIDITVNRRTVARTTPYGIQRTTFFQINYAKDSPDLSWKLITSATAVVMLIRCNNISTSDEAVHALVRRGVACHTISIRSRNTCQTDEANHRTRNDCNRSFIRSREPDGRQYNEYMVRLLDLLHQSHMRAAFMAGGIINRLMQDAIYTENDELFDMWLDMVAAGPSDNTQAHEVIVEEENGEVGVDDALSEEECMVICGAYRLYTSKFIIRGGSYVC